MAAGVIIPVFQIVPVPPGAPAGGLNCQCAVAAMCVDHATGGKHRPAASDVRGLCRNDDGSPDRTGGTTLRQVERAVDLGWNVDLDVSTPMDFEAMWKRLADPELVASVSIQYSALRGTPAYASRTGFTGAHQVLVRRSGNATWEYDPLADGRGVPLAPVRITKALLRTAAGRLNVNSHGLELGIGKAYVGFARAPKVVPKPRKYSVRFSTQSFWVYGVQGGVAIGRVSKRFQKATSAPCAAPDWVPFNGQRRKLARITKGTLTGSYVEPGRGGLVLVTT